MVQNFFSSAFRWYQILDFLAIVSKPFLKNDCSIDLVIWFVNKSGAAQQSHRTSPDYRANSWEHIQPIEEYYRERLEISNPTYLDS